MERLERRRSKKAFVELILSPSSRSTWLVRALWACSVKRTALWTVFVVRLPDPGRAGREWAEWNIGPHTIERKQWGGCGSHSHAILSCRAARARPRPSPAPPCRPTQVSDRQQHAALLPFGGEPRWGLCWFGSSHFGSRRTKWSPGRVQIGCGDDRFVDNGDDWWWTTYGKDLGDRCGQEYLSLRRAGACACAYCYGRRQQNPLPTRRTARTRSAFIRLPCLKRRRPPPRRPPPLEVCAALRLCFFNCFPASASMCILTVCHLNCLRLFLLLNSHWIGGFCPQFLGQLCLFIPAWSLKFTVVLKDFGLPFGVLNHVKPHPVNSALCCKA